MTTPEQIREREEFGIDARRETDDNAGLIPSGLEPTLERELAAWLNRRSQENASNTPDWILAQYLLACLAAWNTGVQQRETWYGRDPRPGAPILEPRP